MIPKPMLASPQKKGHITNWTDWALEQKYDGHRVLITIDNARHGKEICAFSRDGEHVRELPDHLVAELEKLAPGIYDGELLGGDTGTDVTRKDLAHERSIVLFDVLLYDGISCTPSPYHWRRETLRMLVLRANMNPNVVFKSSSVDLKSEKDALTLVKTIWDADGEGAILKRLDSRYVHKRSSDWIKIKRVTHAILTVVGFEATRGKVMDRGPFAVVVLRDDDGNETTVKTKNDQELATFNRQWAALCGKKMAPTLAEHPAIGRRLMIEFPRRTRTGGYQGPVLWDRWAEKEETL